MKEVTVKLVGFNHDSRSGCVYPENELKRMVEQFNEQLKNGEKPLGELTHKNI